MKILTCSHSNKPVLTEKQVNAGYVVKDITIKSYDEDVWFLAPTWDLVNKYKSGKISEYEYTNDYNELINRRYKFLFKSDIQKLNKNLILVCYCQSGQFCHRYLAAKFLQSKGGIYYGEHK